MKSIDALQRQIGVNIYSARMGRNIALRSLAKESGTSLGNLSKIENGTGNPTVETLVRLCRAMNVPLNRILPEIL